MIVIFTDPDGDAASDEFQATVAEAVEPLADEPIVDEILTYAEVGDATFVSEDGDRTFALVRLTEEMEEAVDDVEGLAELIDAPAGVEMSVTGIPVVQQEFNEAVEQDLLRAELISFPIALIILLAVFGTLVSAALPLIIAGLALPTSIAIIGLLATQTEMSIFVTNVTTMIGLALSIDYSLFMVSRFREELRHRSVADAVEHTMATVGKAVAISGVAVAIGLGSLVVFESPALRSMGIGGMVTVLSTLILGLTVLPALLGMLGPRVNRLRVPLPRSLRLIEDDPDAADARQGHGIWSRIARRVMRRPLLIATPVLGALLLAGLPFLAIQLSTGGNLDDLPPSESVTGFRILADEFPSGDTDPVEIALRANEPLLTDGALEPDVIEELDVYVDELAALDGASSVTSVLDPPPGMDDATYRQLIALPEDQRPAEVAFLATWLERTVVDDIMRVDVLHLVSAGLERRAGAGARHPRRPRPRLRRGQPDGRALGTLERLHGQLHRISPVGDRHRRHGDWRRPVPHLRIGLPAAQGGAHEPAQHHRQLRCPGLDLPAGQSLDDPGLRSVRHAGCQHADPDVRHPLRALDGLRGVPPVTHSRALPGHRG